MFRSDEKTEGENRFRKKLENMTQCKKWGNWI